MGKTKKDAFDQGASDEMLEMALLAHLSHITVK